MAYQTSDIVTQVQKRIRDTNYDKTEIIQYLNDTQNDVFNEYRLPFMEATEAYTLAANVSDISNGTGLPSDFSIAIDLFDTTAGQERLIPYKDVKDIDFLYADEDDTTIHPSNKALYWYFYGRIIRVFPAPAGAYTLTLRYYKIPTLLAADADIPSIPSNFQELLVVGAAYRVLQIKDNYDQAAVLHNKYDEILQKLVVQTAVKQVGNSMQQRINRYQTSKRSF